MKEQKSFASALENERSRLYRVSNTYLLVPMTFNSTINETAGNIDDENLLGYKKAQTHR